MSAGIQSQISFKKESTWGIAVTPDKSLAVRPTGGIAIKENIAMLPAIKGQLQKYYEGIKGKVAYEGDLTFDAFGDYLAYFFLSAMGTDTPATHAGETIVYDHVITETNPKPSFTIEQGIGENCRRYAGSIVHTLKITGKVGEPLEATASIMAKTQASATQISPAFTTVAPFNHTQLAVKLGGSTIGEVEDFEFTYKNGLEMVYALGNAEPSYASISGGSEVSGKVSLYLDSTSLTRFTNYLATTKEAIELIATGGAIGSAAFYVLDINVPKAIYTAGETKITDAHNLLVVEFNGVYDTSTSKLLGVTITNLLATLE